MNVISALVGVYWWCFQRHITIPVNFAAIAKGDSIQIPFNMVMDIESSRIHCHIKKCGLL